MPKQPQGRQVVGQLVDAGGGKAVVGAQVAEQALVCQHAVIVHAGVAQADAHGVDPVALADLHQAAGGGIQASSQPISRQLAPVGVQHLFHRLAQAIRVLVDIAQGHRLGADVAAAQRVVGVALDGDDVCPRSR